MDTLLIIVLIVLVVGVVLSGRASPQVIYIQPVPQASAGVGCLLPLVFVGFILLLLFAGR